MNKNIFLLNMTKSKINGNQDQFISNMSIPVEKPINTIELEEIKENDEINNQSH